MKGNIKKLTAKGKPKSNIEKQLAHIKKVRGIEREIAKENKEFNITWIPTNRVHTDKKKKADKQSSRKYKYNPNKE